jgi:hypothetical protein
MSTGVGDVSGGRVILKEKIAHTILSCFVAITMGNPTGSFKRRQELRRPHSDNPKTVRNRQNEASKVGLDAALLRADVAFRTAKSRKLSSLHQSPEWLTMNARQQVAAEQKVVKPLESKRDQRKREHELEWRFKIETGRIEPDEDDSEPMDHKKPRLDDDNGKATEKDLMFDDNDEEWSDCEGQEDWLLMGEEIIDIKKRYERKHNILVQVLGAQANRQEREYEMYKERRLKQLGLDGTGDAEPMETD